MCVCECVVVVGVGWGGVTCSLHLGCFFARRGDQLKPNSWMPDPAGVQAIASDTTACARRISHPLGPLGCRLDTEK